MEIEVDGEPIEVRDYSPAGVILKKVGKPHPDYALVRDDGVRMMIPNPVFPEDGPFTTERRS